ncbi:MAG: hypothetical protein PHE36_02455 [Novosphingobium sp.]|nr:hypothetical protein [Novosphingobium sp.]
MKRMVRNGIALSLAATAGLAAAVSAQAPEPTVLDRIVPGNWEIRFRPGNAKQSVCVRDGWEFIQLRHPTANCSRYVVENTADRITVQYTCRGHGYGRTHIRRESGQLIQIEGQGIVDGLPFQFSAEARRVGRCDN